MAEKPDISAAAPNSAREYVQRWDEGRALWSLELGGIGPGYEQALQVLAIELVRDHLEESLPLSSAPEWGDETVKRLRGTCGNFSNAQIWAARWLARKVLTLGPRGLRRQARERGQLEREIRVSRFWPRSPIPRKPPPPPPTVIVGKDIQDVEDLEEVEPDQVLEEEHTLEEALEREGDEDSL